VNDFGGRSSAFAAAVPIPPSIGVVIHATGAVLHPDVDLLEAPPEVRCEHAAAVVTLTPGAAETIEARGGQVAEVLPRTRPVHAGYVVGLHAESLGADMDVRAVAPVLAATVAGLPGARLRIDIHHEVFDPGARAYAPDVGEALRTLADTSDQVELREHDSLSDEGLWEYLTAIDVSVVPYGFSTHSGWLEACSDLGTTVVAPSGGYYAEQRSCVTYRHDEHGLDRASLAGAVQLAYAQGPGARANPGRRREKRRAPAAAHRSLYSRLLR
jgi:hypothetical protein